MANIFGIQRPEMMECSITSYKWNRQILTVKIKRENSPEVFYLRFTRVEFFAGPMMWKGADFRTGSDADCLELLQMTGRIGEFATEDTIRQIGYKLYGVDVGDNVTLQIIAAKANKFSG
jgi:hypothetical protein